MAFQQSKDPGSIFCAGCGDAWCTLRRPGGIRTPKSNPKLRMLAQGWNSLLNAELARARLIIQIRARTRLAGEGLEGGKSYVERQSRARPGSPVNRPPRHFPE